ncbi:MAG: NAD-dependent dehydratase, partial [Bacteroidales bacterium]|nr:NAD-dependent dehydratase [Bacteroidales bacterium]
MKALFIGGTGNISTPVSQKALDLGISLYHLHRGYRQPLPGVNYLTADITDFEKVRRVLKDHPWECV